MAVCARKKTAFLYVCFYCLLTVLGMYLFGKLPTLHVETHVKTRQNWLSGLPGDYRYTSIENGYHHLGDDIVEGRSEEDVEYTGVVNDTWREERSVRGYYLLDSNKPFRSRCSRCALVASSGHLFRSGAGVDIDKADCVLRMNTAPVTGWTEDVGSRTDIRIIGHVNIPRGLVQDELLKKEILENAKTRTKYIIVPWLYTEKVDMSTNQIIQLARNFSKDYPQVQFVFQTEEKYNESEALFLQETGRLRNSMNTWFSTGFVSMRFALDACDEVHIYGMAKNDFCVKHSDFNVPYHYYEPKGLSECEFLKKHEVILESGHKFLTERTMFARWSLIYNISFHYPSWKASLADAMEDIDTHPLLNFKVPPQNLRPDQMWKRIVDDNKRRMAERVATWDQRRMGERILGENNRRMGDTIRRNIPRRSTVLQPKLDERQGGKRIIRILPANDRSSNAHDAPQRIARNDIEEKPVLDTNGKQWWL